MGQSQVLNLCGKRISFKKICEIHLGGGDALEVSELCQVAAWLLHTGLEEEDNGQTWKTMGMDVGYDDGTRLKILGTNSCLHKGDQMLG